jgi:putative hydrolase of the HAD superfamily
VVAHEQVGDNQVGGNQVGDNQVGDNQASGNGLVGQDRRAFDAVVFDFGGVIISPITGKVEALAASRDLELHTLLHVLLGPMDVSTPDHPWHQAERGELAVADLQAGVAPLAAEHGLELQGDEMAFLFDLEYSFNQPVLDRVASLRTEGYRTALLTNSVREFRPTLERQVDMGLFDVVVDSSFEGCRKPEPAIYERTSERLGVAPERIVFLDDFGPNIAGARKAGWTAIHVTDPVQALADLDQLLTR